MGAVVILWISEALPLPVTAIMGAVACVVLRVAPARDVFAPFADPLMFLFIGSFMLARAIMLHGLDRRVAYAVLSLRVVGASPTRILFAFGAVTASISAWISNTATTAMMFAIALAILSFMRDAAKREGRRLDPALRDRADADDVLRRFSRRARDSHRNAAQRHRSRIHPAAHRN